jgi:hypothetical protein
MGHSALGVWMRPDMHLVDFRVEAQRLIDVARHRLWATLHDREVGFFRGLPPPHHRLPHLPGGSEEQYPGSIAINSMHRPQFYRLVSTRQLVTQYAQRMGLLVFARSNRQQPGGFINGYQVPILIEDTELRSHAGNTSCGGFDNHLVARPQVVVMSGNLLAVDVDATVFQFRRCLIVLRDQP